MALDYLRDPAEIYRRSFAAIEAEAPVSRLEQAMQPVATRIIHACGMVDALDELAYSPGAAEAGIRALQRGTSIFCDVEMVRAGIIEKNLPQGCETLCLLNDPRAAEHGKQSRNTRSAAAVDFWDERLQDSICVVGNAPTALFRLLERLDDGAPKPAVIIGMPVGFVGAMESKAELAADPRGCAFITLHGRRGGSAIAAAALNALAAQAES